jgi:hypothetical protein
MKKINQILNFRIGNPVEVRRQHRPEETFDQNQILVRLSLIFAMGGGNQAVRLSTEGL